MSDYDFNFGPPWFWKVLGVLCGTDGRPNDVSIDSQHRRNLSKHNITSEGHLELPIELL